MDIRDLRFDADSFDVAIDKGALPGGLSSIYAPGQPCYRDRGRRQTLTKDATQRLAILLRLPWRSASKYFGKETGAAELG